MYSFCIQQANYSLTLTRAVLQQQCW